MRTPQTDVHVYFPTGRRLRGNLSRASEHVDDCLAGDFDLVVVGTWQFVFGGSGWPRAPAPSKASLPSTCPLAWTFLAPVFGVGLGTVVLIERPRRSTVAGLCLVVGSL